MTAPSLLPPNASALERGLEVAMARLADVPVPFRQLADPDSCPVALLPYLAWALSIDTWSSDWPEAIKRSRIRHAIAIQRHKGTTRSVRDVVASFGGVVALREWWQSTPAGDPHTFSLVLDLNDRGGQVTTAAFVDQVVAEVSRTKPVRSHFTFTQAIAAAGGLVPIAGARPAIFARLALAAPAA